MPHSRILSSSLAPASAILTETLNSHTQLFVGFFTTTTNQGVAGRYDNDIHNFGIYLMACKNIGESPNEACGCRGNTLAVHG